jgi:hypothetical protein
VPLSSIAASMLLAAACCTVPALASGQAPPPGAARATPATDLDAFMQKVLARRDVNRKMLNDYVLDEIETFEILGPGRMRLHRTTRDYTWYVRDGMHVRSPVRFNGVRVGDEARDRYEADWIRREKARQARREKKLKEDREITVSPGAIDVGATSIPTEPRFVSEAYFMDFKFEPGNYLLAGREQFEGHDVLRIEYYPTRLFGGRDRKAPREIRRDVDPKTGERELEDDIERRMNKTALVTLWVDPANHQIVKYTFENVWLDFLPGAWLVRVDELHASMTMGQPFPVVWLPRDIDIRAAVLLANGAFEANYARAFSEYREAEVTTKIRIPKGADAGAESEPPDDVGADGDDGDTGGFSPQRNGGNEDKTLSDLRYLRSSVVKHFSVTSVTSVDSRTQEEIVREVRVHGNAFLSDAEVLKIAAVTVGDPVTAETLALVERRLRQSGRFETVDVRKRYRSLSDPTDVAIVLVVHEEPGLRSIDDPTHAIARPWLRARQGLMFLPILGYEDGYGLTYGARFTVHNALGLRERISTPLTWGGTRRAAVEVERAFDRGPLTRVLGSVGLSQRENPAYHFFEERGVDDRRFEWKGRAERNFAHVVLAGVDVTRAHVKFGPFPAVDQWTIGADAALDTRGDPAFPRNAVYAGVGWNALHHDQLPRINRYRYDGRGYLGLVGQAVLAGRVQYFTSDRAQPIHERYLIGGAATLRGFRAGAFHGNRAIVTSGELRVPLTSVISGATLGLNVFHDAAKAVDHDVSLRETRWQRSTGAGLFLIASVLRLNLDVARAHNVGGTRVHLSTGFAF